MPVRRDGESLIQFLMQLEAAIVGVIENEICVDEINV